MGSLVDLNTKLFEQLDNLSKKDISEADLDKEIKKSEMVVKIAGVIIHNGELALKAAKFKDDMLDANAKIPKMLEE
ncbi:Phage protein [Fusobacterium sp. oral taxon C10]